jgi:hypothetical protein
MNSNTNFDDDIRRPDEYYMDTLIPSYPPFFEPTPITRDERRQIEKLTKKENKTKNKKTYNPPILSTQHFMTEEEKNNRLNYFEENQTNEIQSKNKDSQEIYNPTEEDIIKQSILEYEEFQRKQEEEMEEEIIKQSILEYEENEKRRELEEKLRVRKTLFENTKKQMEKLEKMDKTETYYTTILQYISAYENENLEKIELETGEYQKYLKIIRQIRLPDNEKTALYAYITQK